MTVDASYLSELTGVFIDEVEDQLQTMDREILRLEQQGESEETIQSLFRAAHTLKGSSAAMGFEEMKQLTHEMEHVLDQVRNRRLQVTGAMTNLLFKCLDQLKRLKDEFVDGNGFSTEIAPLVQELQHFAAKPVTGSGGVDSDSQTFLFTSSAKEMETRSKIQEAQEQGLFVYDIRVRIAPDAVMKSARALIVLNQCSSWGEVLRTLPSLEELGEEDDSLLDEIQYILASPSEALPIKESLLSVMDIAGVAVLPHSAEEMNVKSEEADASDVPKPIEKTVFEEGKRKSQTIRVDVARLEQLMNLVGELVIDQTRIREVGSILNNRYASDDDVDVLAQVSDHVSRVVGELQEGVMKVRMLPIDQLFNRFPRMIRDLAQSLNKEIDLVIEGRETELDRTVIEEIGDPLIHLIRNAVDHGIESTDERLRAGKSAAGQLKITASHEENQVVITVADDGAGIDPGRLRESAIRKGILSEEEAALLSEKESIHLIFRPGFSTAESVSDVSGRGVGMDIVRNHIEKLSGTIDIETQLGTGTRFKIKLPLTLAIITGLLIKLEGRTYILPMSSVVEIVRLPPTEIQTIKGDSVVVIRKQVLPVVWLHEYFNIPRAKISRKHLPIVVVGTAEKRFALVVDELNGNQEIVVKSLGSYIGKINCVSGATILGNGSVALILEVSAIARMIAGGTGQ
jgi:two-component system chemotaxis sensor kinase CheA